MSDDRLTCPEAVPGGDGTRPCGNRATIDADGDVLCAIHRAAKRRRSRAPERRTVFLSRREYEALRSAVVIVDAANLDGADPKVLTGPLRDVLRRWRDAAPDDEPASGS